MQPVSDVWVLNRTSTPSFLTSAMNRLKGKLNFATFPQILLHSLRLLLSHCGSEIIQDPDPAYFGKRISQKQLYIFLFLEESKTAVSAVPSFKVCYFRYFQLKILTFCYTTNLFIFKFRSMIWIRVQKSDPDIQHSLSRIFFSQCHTLKRQ